MLVPLFRNPAFTNPAFTLAGGALFTVLLLAACAFDVRSRRIPNRLVATLFLSGALFSAVAGGSRGATASVLGGGLGFGIWLPFYALRWLGAGDVKLFAAAGAWLWPGRTLEAALLSALAGGVLALLWMVCAYGVSGAGVGLSLAFSSPRHRAAVSAADTRRVLPYGVALAAGALYAAWFPDLFSAAEGVARAAR